jgi:hypothetical protein
VEPREHKQINIFGLIWARDKTARKNIAFFVLLFGGKIKNNPYVNPAIGLLALIELGAINRQYQYHIFLLDISLLDCITVCLPMINVTVDRRWLLAIVHLILDLICLLATIFHFLGTLGATPETL